MNAPSIFSRILLIVGALAVVGLTYWFIATSLAPIEVPSAAPARGSVRFDPQADVTKHPQFPALHLLGPALSAPSAIGRENPFAPVPVQAVVTSTTGTAEMIRMPTSTAPAAEPATTTAVTATSTP